MNRRLRLACSDQRPLWPSTKSRKKEYEKVRLANASVPFISLLLLAPTAHAQNKAAKVQAIAQQLDLTPQQKIKILPILADEAPKVEAIKNDNSLSKVQKIQQIRAIHRQTDPQMKAILSQEQYQKLQAIRQQAIKDAVQAYGR